MPTVQTRPELRGEHGMVASTHWLASAVGMSVLERGGNAFDAAVAAGFTLQVVEPHLNGPGGEVPILLQAAGDQPQVLCGQGPAPAAATPEALAGRDRLPGSGVLAACVPGAFDAWLTLLRDHGRMSLREVLSPAIGYAHRGFPILPQIADKIAAVEPIFTRYWPSSAEVWLDRGAPPEAMATHRNPDLAATYERLVTEAEAQAPHARDSQIDAARHLWREGFVAERILAFLSRPVPDGSGEFQRALLSGDDLADWRAHYEPTTQLDYHGYTVHKTGPWGQGPVFLQQLGMLRELGIDEVAHDSAEFVHLVTEVAKLALADREAWYGDPSMVDVPLATLLSREYAAERARLVTQADSASLELRPGAPDGRHPFVVPPVLAGTTETATGATGEPTVSRTGEHRGDTCHLDVVDAEGNMVAATPSGGWLSSSPVVPGLGFALGTRAQMFWLDPRSPSVLAPRKRPRTTLSPTLVTAGGEPVLALGTPGGDQQDQWSLTYFLRLVHGGLNLQAGIDAPMFHTNAAPSSFHPREMAPGELVVESRLGDGDGDGDGDTAIAELERRGHRVVRSGGWSLGRLSAVARDPNTGQLRAGANPRGAQGYAVGR
ncbi:gamma-glutamyltransferase family protein [Lipingzhangella sp. LS1_29]|uniref:Gamma-glutamyltransferase family protein n=1 Tax=Lipingzhangella rawalii TaxID=2055835 RepID=A0ABU2H7Z5_9ACTN|nr:gamma-glutamyltransferase family protein [Lipingzhangella rawalii]MDS1270969.1 gamma-glutamyltransferase family protein [Lipingzhangella rawalii]